LQVLRSVEVRSMPRCSRRSCWRCRPTNLTRRITDAARLSGLRCHSPARCSTLHQAKMVCIADIDTHSHSARQWTGPATKPKWFALPTSIHAVTPSASGPARRPSQNGLHCRHRHSYMASSVKTTAFLVIGCNIRLHHTAIAGQNRLALRQAAARAGTHTRSQTAKTPRAPREIPRPCRADGQRNRVCKKTGRVCKLAPRRKSFAGIG